MSADGADNTHSIARKHGRKFSNFTLLLPGDRVGKGRDVQYGMLRANGKYVMFMDADMATPLLYIPRFLRLIEKEADVVVATRDIRLHHTFLPRRLLSVLGNIAYRMLGGVWIEDSQCGFKFFTHSAAQQIFSKLTILGWGFDMEVLTIAKSNGLSIKPVRIKRWKDMPGGTFDQSHVATNAIRGLKELFTIFINRIKGTYAPHKFRVTPARLLLLTIPVALLLIPLLSSLLLRPSGDDFPLATSSHAGPVHYFQNFYAHLTGRIGNAVMIFLAYQKPSLSEKLTVATTIGLSFVGLYLLVRRYNLFNSRFPVAMLALLFAGAVIHIPANQYQAIFWLAGFISYALPMGLFLIFFALLRSDMQLRSKKFVGMFLFAFFIGTLHEIVALMGVLLCVCIYISLMAYRSVYKLGKIKTSAKRTVSLLLMSLAYILAFLSNYFAPITYKRREASVTVHHSKRKMVELIMEFVNDLFVQSIQKPAVLLVFLTFCAVVMYSGHNLYTRFIKRPLAMAYVLIIIALLPYATLLLTAAASMYGYGGNPPDRAYFPFEFTLVLCTSLLGIALGIFLKRFMPNGKQRKLLYSGVALFTVYASMGYAIASLNRLELIAYRAHLYDEQELRVKAEIEKGSQTLYLKPLRISEVAHPTPDPKHWVNKGIAKYYGVREVIAIDQP